MLVRFVASNFLSLKEEVEFNMLTGDFKTHPHHVYQAGEVEVLKAAAIYGANGAGKSNLVKAIEYLQRLVQKGSIFEPTGNKKFRLDPKLFEEPIRFEIEFRTPEKLYSYGIAIDYTEILEEWLYESDTMIFERKSKQRGKLLLKLAEKYKKTEKQRLLIELIQDNLLESHELFISKNRKLKVADDIDAARAWIETHIRVIYPRTKYEGLIQDILESKATENYMNETLGAFDTEVEKYRFKGGCAR